jgi:hypothetical protein
VTKCRPQLLNPKDMVTPPVLQCPSSKYSAKAKAPIFLVFLAPCVLPALSTTGKFSRGDNGHCSPARTLTPRAQLK